MSFLWPLAWGLLGLAVPIVMLYLIRQQMRFKSVSTLLFWTSRSPKLYNMPLWRRLRRLLSLLLQLLFLVLLVAALSRPLWPGQGKEALSVVLLLDASPTLGAVDAAGLRWDQARQALERQIQSLRFFDEAMLIRSGATPEILCTWTNRPSDLRAALNKARPSGNTSEILPALSLAKNLAASRARGKVVLVTDGVWVVPPEKEQLEGVNTVWLGRSAINAGITLFSARRSLVAPEDYQLALTIEHNDSITHSGELILMQDGRLLDALSVEMIPGKAWHRSWNFQGKDASVFTSEFKPNGTDVWLEDNRAETRVQELKPLRVALVSTPNAFLETALKVIPMVSVHRLEPSEMSAIKVDDADLWVFHEAAVPDGFNGKAVLLIHPEGKGFWGEQQGRLEKPLITDVRPRTTILQFTTLHDVGLQSAGDYIPAAGAIAYATSLGKPLIFGNWERFPNWLVLGFPLEDSDLVFRTTFPILLNNLAGNLRTGETGGFSQVPGHVATRLKATVEITNASPKASGGWEFWQVFFDWPLWSLALMAGVLWVMVEWFLYTRRITE